MPAGEEFDVTACLRFLNELIRNVKHCDSSCSDTGLVWDPRCCLFLVNGSETLTHDCRHNLVPSSAEHQDLLSERITSGRKKTGGTIWYTFFWTACVFYHPSLVFLRFCTAAGKQAAMHHLVSNAQVSIPFITDSALFSQVLDINAVISGLICLACEPNRDDLSTTRRQNFIVEISPNLTDQSRETLLSHHAGGHIFELDLRPGMTKFCAVPKSHMATLGLEGGVQ